MEMERVATEGKLLLPQELPHDVNEEITMLSTAKGKAFDQEYTRRVELNKQRLIDIFASGIDVTTSKVSQFAKRTSIALTNL
ncbi:DUF4142 domain-containing protein [Pedobacter steynii]|uniref:DUF4142 domain-containing protein n=1 Tax=Pedobacter steynii TaxID=430522 RepID=A0A1D7QJN5_9SPHI|nr:DUF4142 domain-containing protein [Pedobacter steynii]AOM78882.1 hypothetical protein BFS30_17915 [Pedobacter steynii]